MQNLVNPNGVQETWETAMSHTQPPSREIQAEMSGLDILGGDLSLDFANTVDRGRAGGTRHEYLQDYNALVDWARHVGIIDNHSRSRLPVLAMSNSDEADHVFQDALDFREAIDEIFSAVASGTDPSESSLDVVQRHYRRAVAKSSLRPCEGVFDWRFRVEPDQLDSILWPVAIAALDLLRYGRLDRIRQCPGDDGHCGWLFLDRSKNGSRRWCSMETCGSRDKMRRHYRKKKSSNTRRAPG